MAQLTDPGKSATGKSNRGRGSRCRLRGRYLAATVLVAVIVMFGGRGEAEPPSLADTVRFLEQSTFGPTAALIAYVQDVGFEAFLQAQFKQPLASYPDLGSWPQNPPTDCTGTCVRDNYTMYPLQRRFFQNALTGPDQLRQRVAFALNQILVVSAQDGNLRLPSRMLPYLKVLDQNAFGNFRQLLYEITLNPAMGRFLDTVGNNRTAPNENYAREVLQLFSIGLDELNPDGTLRLDPSAARIPTFSQETITNFARVFTGWVFAPAPQAGIVNYFDPMVPGAAGAHDRDPKTLLGGAVLPGGRGAAADLNDALDNIVAHPNVAPFISKNLIQHLVTSNPSPPYVGRVASVFQATGGDLRETVRAILLDPEARGGGSDPRYGHLREPVLWIANLLRAFNTTAATTDFVLGERFLPSDIRMDEDLFSAPSVFNFFPPKFAIPGETPPLLGPEFRIYSTSTAIARANFAYEVIYKKMPISADRPTGTWLDLSPLEPLAGDPVQLVETLNALMLHGGMSPAMRDVVSAAVATIPAANRTARVRDAVYLIATSSQYLVQR